MARFLSSRITKEAFLLDLHDLDAYIESNKHGGADEVFGRAKSVAASRDETRNQIRRLG